MRHIDTAARSLVAIGALTGSLMLTGVALAGRSGGDAKSAPRHPTLVEERGCSDRGRHHIGNPTPPRTAAGATGQRISVSVPPVAMIRLGRGGRPIWVTTNTGCAPAPGDTVYLVQSNGSLVEAPDFDVTRHAWHGDFSDSGRVQQDD